MFIVIKTGLKSTWRKEKARSMTCNPSKFILVLEHKVINVTPVTFYNWKKYQLTLFGWANILTIFFSCLVILRQIIFYTIRLDLTISNKCKLIMM